MKRRILPLALMVAALFTMTGAVAVVTPGVASASSCIQAKHWTQADGVNTYKIYKYECNDAHRTTYAVMTGNPGEACIELGLGNVGDGGVCYAIPNGYTPPRTSIQTQSVKAGDGAEQALIDVCFHNHQNVTEWCKNDSNASN